MSLESKKRAAADALRVSDYHNDAMRHKDDAMRHKEDANRRLNEAERRRDAATAHLSQLRGENAAREDIERAENEVAYERGEVAETRKMFNKACALYHSLVLRPQLAQLSMADVNAWLDANPLTVDQPVLPASSSLWWRMGEQVLNKEAEAWDARTGINVLIGVSGAGKTRSLYEMLARNFGFYWTCSRVGNGGADIVPKTLAPLLRKKLVDSDLPQVSEVVAHLICAYSVLLLQWRRKFPRGSALDWLVFQTAPDVNRRPLQNIGRFLASFVKSSEFVDELLNAAENCVCVDSLMLVVDEAQILTQFGHFSEERRLLSPFARFCGDAEFRSVWFAGTSLSLRISVASLVECSMVFEEQAPFQQYLTEMVGVSFSAPLIAELHALFCGRARRVAVFAEYLIAHSVAELANDEFHERVMDVALQCQSDLLSPNEESGLSIVLNFVRPHNENPGREHVSEWVQMATSAWAAPHVIQNDAAHWFDRGVGKLVAESVVICEPLTAKMLLCAALIIDHGAVLRPMLEMSFTNESARSFLAEVFVIPVINRFIARHLGFHVPRTEFFAVPHADMIDGVQRGLRFFVPEAKVGANVVHTFVNNSITPQLFGVLGQIKFQPQMNESGWAHALRTVVDPAQFVIELMNQQWPLGSCAYIFSVCEPPVPMLHEQAVEGGRTLFVFSPLLCPTLFAADVPGIDVWQQLKQMKFQ